MDKWVVTITLLALYGIFSQIRPSESYLTQYLEGPWKNLTLEEINNEVYPVWTYSYVALLFVVLFITDFLRYKPVIVIEAVAYVVTWVLLLWAQGVLAMQFMEFCYGIVTATEVAYYSYIYAKVPKEKYKFATAVVRAATLVGQCLSGVLAQVLVSTNVMDYHSLNYISLADVSVALVFALFLPSVPVSIYFHRKRKTSNEAIIQKSTTYMAINPAESCSNVQDNISSASYQMESKTNVKIKRSDYERVPFKEVGKVIWADFKGAYTDKFQIKWCLWWVLATCSYEQVVNYIQPLWETIYPSEEHTDLYQGAVDAATTLAGALAALSVGFLNVNWDKWGEYTLAVVSLVQAAILLVSAQTNNIWVAYTFYGLYSSSYHMLITIATFQVAKNLREDSYGLIFGCNQFLALLLQTVLTVIVVDESGLNEGPRVQFIIYGTYIAVTGVLYFAIAIYSLCFKNTSSNVSTAQPISSDKLFDENDSSTSHSHVTDNNDQFTNEIDVPQPIH
ncbi:hypothetical protein CHUAL_003924 [Chamberlinius hualienensis]